MTLNHERHSSVTPRCMQVVRFLLFFNNGYKAPFLEPQDHARMKDLEILVLMVALESLHEFSRPIPYQILAFISRYFFIILSATRVPPRR